MKQLIWLTIAAVAVLAIVLYAGFSGSLSGKSEQTKTPQQKLVAEVAKAFPDAIFYKKTTEKVVALTIDDLPTPKDTGDRSTQLILDAIAEHNQQFDDADQRARATFFIITSHLNDGSTIVTRILQQGHEIANHGIVDDTIARLPPEEFEQQLRESHERLSQLSSQPIRWYRPGRGLYNQKMVQILRRLQGYESRFALASMLPVDTLKPTNDPTFTAWYVSQHIFPGSILLLHGGSPERSQKTAKALKLILEELKQRNYRVVTLSELWDNY